jgi:acetoacetyl-CoA synthetase
MVDLNIAGAASAPADAHLAQEAAARLFRSVRAGRKWLLSRAATAAAKPNSACAEMKPGNDSPPMFLIPGAPGSILQLGPIAAAMTGPMPVYAVRPRGLEEGETPCETIREMAGYAIAQIKKLRPRGPYPLVGYSAGGLVALEMAQQLAASGDEVPLLVLLDTYPSRAVWPLACHAEILGRQVFRALWALRRFGPVSLVREVARRIRSLAGYLSASGVSVLPPPPLVAEGVSAASRRVHLASYNAGEAYRPSPYAGKVLFVQPREVPNLEPRTPSLVWRKFLRDLEIRRVPGSHLGMVDDGAAAIGECLSQFTAFGGSKS